VSKYLRSVGIEFGKLAAEDFKDFGDFVSLLSTISSLLPIARFDFAKRSDVWVIVFKAAGSHSVKCLGIFAEEVVKQMGCIPDVEYKTDEIIARVKCKRS